MRIPGHLDALWAQEDLTAAPSWPPPVPLCLCVLPHIGALLLLLSTPTREAPLLGVGSLWSPGADRAEPSGTEACPGLSPTAGGVAGGSAQGVPVCQGIGRSRPSEGRDSI